ncbi:hypothetical protein ACWDG1_49920 [Streptomyces sp. NPDC001177]
MTTSTWRHSRRTAAAAAASVLAVTAVAVGVLILALSVRVPETWWPHTGQAFATDPRPARQDPCGLIAGPAKAYCEHDTRNRTHTHPDAAGAAWRLVPAGAGLAALVMWRRRSSSGRRRR